MSQKQEGSPEQEHSRRTPAQQAAVVLHIIHLARRAGVVVEAASALQQLGQQLGYQKPAAHPQAQPVRHEPGLPKKDK